MQAMSQMPGSTAAVVEKNGLAHVAPVLARFMGATKDTKH